MVTIAGHSTGPMYYAHCREFVPSKGAGGSPLKLNINFSTNTSATLTWLPPATQHSYSFNYTLNTTSSSSRTDQVYNITSLTLANLTHGKNYLFAVAVTDSTGHL